MLRELNVVFGDGRALGEIKEIALRSDGPIAVRIAALETLTKVQPHDLREICQQLVTEPYLNVVAARALARFDDPAVAQRLIEQYGRFREPDRPTLWRARRYRRDFFQRGVDVTGL